MVRLRLELVQHEKNKKKLAVLHIDLDRFRTINDTLGHAIGDKVIKAVTERLRELTRKNDTLAPDRERRVRASCWPTSSGSKRRRCSRQRLVDTMRKPLNVDGHELYTTVSVGMSIYPEDGNDAEVLLKNADIAVSTREGLGQEQFSVLQLGAEPEDRGTAAAREQPAAVAGAGRDGGALSAADQHQDGKDDRRGGPFPLAASGPGPARTVPVHSGRRRDRLHQLHRQLGAQDRPPRTGVDGCRPSPDLHDR